MDRDDDDDDDGLDSWMVDRTAWTVNRTAQAVDKTVRMVRMIMNRTVNIYIVNVYTHTANTHMQAKAVARANMSGSGGL